MLGVGDLSLAADHLPGDLLAVACSFLFSAYFLVGKRLRSRLDTTTYVVALYGAAALFGFALFPVLDLPLVDWGGRNWLCFVLMALVPTMIGHSSFNFAIKYLPAGVISTATLAEPLMAGLVAAVAWGEAVTPSAIAGYALVCASVAVLVVRSRGGTAGAEAP